MKNGKSYIESYYQIVNVLYMCLDIDKERMAILKLGMKTNTFLRVFAMVYVSK